MGIKGLAKLLSDEAPQCIREDELKSLQGRKIAIDASMAIYQFLIAVRSNGGGGGGAPNQPSFMLTNADGETTSHIQGMFNRTIRFLSEGIRPVFVFDGKPPRLKSGELLKRRDKRDKAQAALQQATEEGNVQEQDKQSKRLVRAGQKENEDCRRLLTLMGVPVVQAPCEAEAQASHLAKRGLVYATGTEDMDALTFQTPILVRKLTFANASKSMVQTIHYQKALEGLDISYEQFVDLCILLGCDYCDTIKGVGPKTALKLIREHVTIEQILKVVDRKKYTVPESWIPNEHHHKNKEVVEDATEDEESPPADKKPIPSEGDKETEEQPDEEEIVPAYVQARHLFYNHEVTDDVELKWKPCQEEELTKFLVDEMGFSPDRVKNSIDKLQAAYKANSKPQTRMDAFFQVKPSSSAKNAAPLKRKQDNQVTASRPGKGANKRGKR